MSPIPTSGQQTFTLFVLDLIITATAYYQVRPNPGIQLLFVASVLKSIAIPALLIGANYTSSYSGMTVGLITSLVEVGYFFNDHIVSVSALQRAQTLFDSSVSKIKFLFILTASSIFIGGALRMLRSFCRLGSCLVMSSFHLDMVISINVLLLETILLGALALKSIQNKHKSISDLPLIHVLIKECSMRAVIFLPLALLEAVSFAIPDGSGPSAVKWIMDIGMYVRLLAPSILVVVILSTKENYRSKVSDEFILRGIIAASGGSNQIKDEKFYSVAGTELSAITDLDFLRRKSEFGFSPTKLRVGSYAANESVTSELITQSYIL